MGECTEGDAQIAIVAELTERRYPPGHDNEEMQFRALMGAVIAHARALNFKPSIALNADQAGQLTTNMVQLVEREVVLPIGTTTALVPQI